MNRNPNLTSLNWIWIKSILPPQKELLLKSVKAVFFLNNKKIICQNNKKI